MPTPKNDQPTEDSEAREKQTKKKLLPGEDSRSKSDWRSQAVQTAGEVLGNAIEKSPPQYVVWIVIIILLAVAYFFAFALNAKGHPNLAFAAGMVPSGLVLVIVILIFALHRRGPSNPTTEFANEVAKKAPPQQDRQGEPLPEVAPVLGKWRTTYYWTDTAGAEREYHETLELAAGSEGREVVGTITDDEGQNSRCQGLLFNRKLVIYVVSERGDRISCGSATLDIAPDTRSMSGYCAWYDVEENRILESKYDLEPID
jgi:hypothetical protein